MTKASKSLTKAELIRMVKQAERVEVRLLKRIFELERQRAAAQLTYVVTQDAVPYRNLAAALNTEMPLFPLGVLPNPFGGE